MPAGVVCLRLGASFLFEGAFDCVIGKQVVIAWQASAACGGSLLPSCNATACNLVHCAL